MLTTVHTADYVAAVQAASADPEAADPAYGLGTDDDPAFAGCTTRAPAWSRAPARCAPTSGTGRTQHGVNFCGGLHHAMAGNASGFCIYNDIAVGIQWLLDHGAQRVAYVDIDVHHGDGVERIFWDDPRVLTISLHESGRALFPGTGFAGDIGGPSAQGEAVNIALPPGTGDSTWLRALHSTASAAGAGLQARRARHPARLRHPRAGPARPPGDVGGRPAGGRRVAAPAVATRSATGAGWRWAAAVTSWSQVVPRAWTHLTAIAAHRPIALTEPVPTDWLDHVRQAFGREGPRRMGDLDPADGPIWRQPWDLGYNPHDEVDRAIMATREAVFALHGLDVWFD